MKVVLFCGGMGLRLREYSEQVPKPMVPIGERPILWHLMKYYAHYGVRDFILCLGHRADAIKRYFLEYDECASNDFVYSQGGKSLTLLHSDIADWQITFVDTGLHACIGERLMAVRQHVENEEVFLANYADNLTSARLPLLIEHNREHDSVATFLAVKPSQSFHVARVEEDSTVREICPVTDADVWINGGFFVLRPEIFDFMEAGDELVLAPFQRLIQRRKLTAYKHEGFWAAMDTLKEKQMLEDLHNQGRAPWEIWRRSTAPVVGRCVPMGGAA